MSTVRIDSDLLQAAVAALPENALSETRHAAVSEFLREGLPTTRHEDWKYTNLGKVAERSNAWLGSQVPPIADTAAQLKRLQTAIDADWIINADRTLNTAQRVANVSLLSDALPTDGLIVDDPITRLNAALLSDGYRVVVPANRETTTPLGLLIAADTGVQKFRLVLDVERGARAQFVILTSSSDQSNAFTNCVTEVRLADGARVDIVQINEAGPQHMGINTLHVTQERDSTFHHSNFDLGGAFVRNDVKVDIQGPGAETIMNGLYLASDGQHIDNHTRVDHRVGPAVSHESYRGILGRGARCVFNGKAIVHAGADGTDANQANHNLLLSENAEINTKPELEIYADDVKCSHGATVGQLDEKALFYLRSRGLSEADAAAVLTRAFAASVLSELTLNCCHDYLATSIDDRLDAVIAASRSNTETSS